MGEIPFTQYLRPNGRAVDIFIERPDDIVAKAQVIIDAGLRFECEVLSDNVTASLTIADRRRGRDVACQLIENIPTSVAIGVDELILTFDLGAYRRAGA